MMKENRLFHGKTAVITGAGSGIGRALAEAAGRRGMSLVLVDNQPDLLHSLCDGLRKLGIEPLVQSRDVTDAAALVEIAAQTVARFGAPHLLINNAGIFAGGLIWELTAAEWDRVLRVNLLGVANGISAFAPVMLRAARADPEWEGHIVNTASMAGLVGLPLGASYSVAKHGVVALSEILHHDLAAVTEQVRCAVFCPSFVETKLAARASGHPNPTPSQQLARKLVRGAMAHAQLDVDEVAELLFAGLAIGRFYIHTHPEQLAALKERRTGLMDEQKLAPSHDDLDLARLLGRISPRRAVP